MNEIHSRSVLAGYDPDRLHQSRVLVVGVGALGQNIVQDLSLSGIGNLLLVDFDVFEPHNATRSPYYPTGDEQSRFGLAKVPIVAERAYNSSTDSSPEVLYIESHIQLVGDAAILWADVIVSAVDSVTARAWLAERCRLHGKPLVEGGFSGALFNMSAFSGESGTACYRCVNPSRASSASCTMYALAAEAAHVIPAIQSTAAVLGGLITEQIIQILHGDYQHFGKRVYGDIRRVVMDTALLQVDASCPGQHQRAEKLGKLSGLKPTATLGDLAHLVNVEYGEGMIILAEPLHITYPCTRCGVMCHVQATESAWLARARCEECGGPWSSSDAQSPTSVTVLDIPRDFAAPFVSPAAATPTASVGIRPGGAILYSGFCGDGLIFLEGDLRSHVRAAEKN